MLCVVLSIFIDSTSKTLYNKSSALNKENIDYACTTADKCVDSLNDKVGTVVSGLADNGMQISNKVGTMLDSAGSSVQRVFPQVSMVVMFYYPKFVIAFKLLTR